MKIIRNDGRIILTDSSKAEFIKQEANLVTVKVKGETYKTKVYGSNANEVVYKVIDSEVGPGPEPVIPIAPMTLRFAFSQDTTDPTTLGMDKGTWSKVKNYPGYSNVWDWTYDNSDWWDVFPDKLTSDLDPDIKIIEGNTNSVTQMTGMFQRCNTLTFVCVFDTSNVTDMRRMFMNCSSLTSVPQFDTRNVGELWEMFRGCSNIESGMLDFYRRTSSTGKVSSYYDCFTDAGTNTESGMAERAQIPTSWGGDYEEQPSVQEPYLTNIRCEQASDPSGHSFMIYWDVYDTMDVNYIDYYIYDEYEHVLWSESGSTEYNEKTAGIYFENPGDHTINLSCQVSMNDGSTRDLSENFNVNVPDEPPTPDDPYISYFTAGITGDPMTFNFSWEITNYSPDFSYCDYRITDRNGNEIYSSYSDGEISKSIEATFSEDATGAQYPMLYVTVYDNNGQSWNLEAMCDTEVDPESGNGIEVGRIEIYFESNGHEPHDWYINTICVDRNQEGVGQLFGPDGNELYDLEQWFSGTADTFFGPSSQGSYTATLSVQGVTIDRNNHGTFTLIAANSGYEESTDNTLSNSTGIRAVRVYDTDDNEILNAEWEFYDSEHYRPRKIQTGEWFELNYNF